MIASIQGTVINKEHDSLIINLGGLGIQIFTTKECCDGTKIGEKIFLFSQLIVREESLTLFGFINMVEKDYFNLLIGVNGVGPKLALAIISTLSIDTINRAILSEQFEIFARVPGVGKKTAQKISIHLQGKIQSDAEFLGTKNPIPDVDLEVLEALTSLGYSIVEAQSAVQFIPKDTPENIEERIKVALQYFS